jgi:hypothetical protein
VILKKSKEFVMFLPRRKADDTASPVLPRVRGTKVQLTLGRLGFTASSTFATLGF